MIAEQATVQGHNQLTSDLHENRVYDGNTEDTELAEYHGVNCEPL